MSDAHRTLEGIDAVRTALLAIVENAPTARFVLLVGDSEDDLGTTLLTNTGVDDAMPWAMRALAHDFYGWLARRADRLAAQGNEQAALVSAALRQAVRAYHAGEEP